MPGAASQRARGGHVLHVCVHGGGVVAQEKSSCDLGHRDPLDIQLAYIISHIQGAQLSRPSFPGAPRQSARPGKPYDEGRAPGHGARPNLHELPDYLCTGCILPDARLGYFILHINTLTIWECALNYAPCGAALAARWGYSEHMLNWLHEYRGLPEFMQSGKLSGAVWDPNSGKSNY